MKKLTRTMLVALLGMTVVGCGETSTSTSSSVAPSTPVSSSISSESSTTSSSVTSNPSSSLTPSVSTSTTDPVQEAIDAISRRIVLVKDKQEVVDDFEVPSKVIYEGNEYVITWTADNAAVTFETVDGVTWARLDRPAKGEEPITVKLTASFTYEGVEATKGFRVIVMPEEGTDDVWGVEPTGTVMSWSDFRSAEKGTVCTIQGRVIAWTYDSSYSNGNVFLQDENGGYYSYRLKASEADYNKYLTVGNEVILEGKKDVYSGLHQLGQDTVTGIKVVSTEFAGQKPAAKDVTEAARNGELEPLQSTWVTALGTYTVGDDGYKYIQIGANKYQLYSDKKYNGETLAEVNETMATFAEGDTIRVTGIVGMYTNPQFYPYAIAKSDETIEVSNEERALIALAAAQDGFKDLYDEVEEVALYASEDSEISVSYALNADADTTVFALNNETNKLTITPSEEEKTATLTITVTCGDVTKTADVTLVACSKIEVISIAEALKIAAEAGDDYSTEKYYVKGTITEVYNTTYGNMYITDGTDTMTIYGTYSKDGNTRYDAMESKPVAGDEVVLYGVLGTYTKNDVSTPQMKNGWIHSFTHTYTTTEAEAMAYEFGDAYSTEKYYVTGTITEVYNTTYGNMKITDGTTEFTVYGTYSADGQTRYDKLETKPVAGDTVTVYGILGTYTKNDVSTPQMKNGWIVNHVPGTTEPEPEDPTPENPTTLTIAEALAKAEEAGDAYTTEKYNVTGTIKEVYNTTYGNMILTDGTNEITIYGTYSADGQTRYDALETKPVAGDTVTVYGILGTYTKNDVSTPQMKNGWIVAHTPNATEPEEPTTVVTTIAEALVAADGTQVSLEGKVTAVEGWNTQYSNMNFTLTDDAGDSIYVFRSTTQVTMNDIVKVEGTIGHYNDNPQIAQGSTVTILEEGVYEEPANMSTYTFSDYEAGTQYAEGEAHELDENVTITTTQCHFTSQLRIYSSSAHDGFAVIESKKAISSITLNAGNNADTLNVYVSEDGVTWTLAEGVAVTSTYTNYTVEFDTATKFIKLDVAGSKQVRVASFSLTFAE